MLHLDVAQTHVIQPLLSHTLALMKERTALRTVVQLTARLCNSSVWHVQVRHSCCTSAFSGAHLVPDCTANAAGYVHHCLH